MNDKVRDLLIFLMGATISALITYRVTKSRYEEIVEEEIEHIREDFFKELGSSGESKTEDDEELDIDRAEDIRTNARLTKKYIRYNSTLDFDEPSATQDIFRGPYVISVTSFNEEMKHYDKVSLQYYNEDDTLTDETDEVINDLITLIGDHALVCFGDSDSNDPDVVYIRNDQLGIDYEIVRLDKSYVETVLGIVGDVPRRKKVVKHGNKEPYEYSRE